MNDTVEHSEFKIAKQEAISILENLRHGAEVRRRHYLGASNQALSKTEKANGYEGEILNIVALNMAIKAMGGTVPLDKNVYIKDPGALDIALANLLHMIG